MFVLQRQGAGLFAKPGLGKTSITLAAIKTLLEAGQIKRAVVVASIYICYSTWPAEIKKWSNFSHLRYSILHGPKKDQALKEDAEIYLINHEGLEWLHDNLPPSWTKDEMIFVSDESTRFKHHDTLRFKILRGGRVHRRGEDGNPVRKKFIPLLKKFSRRLILTGTPESRQYMGLWSQMYIVDLGSRLGRFISHYRNEYYTPDRFGYDWILNEGAAEKIRDKISDAVMYIDDEDNLDLPVLVGDVVGVSKAGDAAQPIMITLPDKARRAYDELENIFITELNGGVITAKNPAIATTKLRQIANGGVYLQGSLADMENHTKTKAYEDLHYAKSEAAASIVEDLHGDPALITYEYHHDLDRLRKVLGKNTPCLGHGVPPAEAARIVEAWNAGDLPSLIVQPQSAAHGLNLQYGGRAIIWHSLTWSYEHYYQLVKRLWRQGQTERVYLYHLVAQNTIDEAVLGTLRAGASTEREFLQALKSFYGL